MFAEVEDVSSGMGAHKELNCLRFHPSSPPLLSPWDCACADGLFAEAEVGMVTGGGFMECSSNGFQVDCVEGC
jgi:hypothetical protein